MSGRSFLAYTHSRLVTDKKSPAPRKDFQRDRCRLLPRVEAHRLPRMFKFLSDVVSKELSKELSDFDDEQPAPVETPPLEKLRRFQTPLAWAANSYVNQGHMDSSSLVRELDAVAALRVRALPEYTAIVDKNGTHDTRVIVSSQPDASGAIYVACRGTIGMKNWETNMRYHMLPHEPGALFDPSLNDRHFKAREPLVKETPPSTPAAPPSRDEILARFGKKPPVAAKSAAAAAVPPPAPSPPAESASKGSNAIMSAETLTSMSVKKLKELAAARGLSTVGCAEKGDLVALVMGAQENSVTSSSSSSSGLYEEDGYVAPSAASVLIGEANKASERVHSSESASESDSDDDDDDLHRKLPADFRGPLAHEGFVDAARSVIHDIEAAVEAAALKPWQDANGFDNSSSSSNNNSADVSSHHSPSRGSGAGSSRSGVREIVVCGHSLGGALANLLALELHHRLSIGHLDLGRGPGDDVRVSIVTFGAPHVGNQAFADCLASKEPSLSSTRAVISDDPVPWLLSSGVHNHAAPYVHYPPEPVTFDAHRGPLQSVVGTMSSAWSSMKVGMAAANQSARAMADAEMEAHSCGSGGGDYTNSREAPRIGFSSVVEGVMATAKAANQQIKEKHSVAVYAKYCFCSAPTANRRGFSKSSNRGDIDDWQRDEDIPPPF